MEPLISDTYTHCHSRFEKLVLTVATCGNNNESNRQKQLKEVEDDFAKFKLWAGNLGAAHSGKTYAISLDYRLRQASFYKQQVSTLRPSALIHMCCERGTEAI